MRKKILYPLLENAFNRQDIEIGKKILDSRKITMGKITENFEKQFAKYVKAKYAVMVNSGSSANLLSVFVSKFLKKINLGDEAIIPAVCWSTSLWPLVQAGMKPVFVDVDLDTYNASLNQIISKITKKTKIIMILHVLGTCGNIDKIKKIAKDKKIILIEDTCEALGAKFKKKNLGTFGDFGTYSFYYSHQITSGEGGMIVTNKKKNYELLKIMRAHGWDRDIKKNKKKIFNFINMGFNLRPLEISAGIASNQLKRLNKFSTVRNTNRNKILNALKRNEKWNNQFIFVKPKKYTEPSWFGLPMLLANKYVKQREQLILKLNRNGIETRPIISGNFLNQKATKVFNLNHQKIQFKNSDLVEKSGFFIGLHTKPINKEILKKIVNTLLDV
jgi:CDP-6-deoxy-D-xylo-4-hexulose-3-dehydrase|tara:strand:- start:2266 stop:3429 length:1164 start_codon:yes stop_codon:yes gene_type:complete